MAALSSASKLIDTARIIHAKGVHRHTIIWIYGLGGNHDGYTEAFVKMQPPDTRIILPQSTKRWVTTKGRQYYLESWWESDEVCVKEGLVVMEKLKELIDYEVRLVGSASHIILGGFSQGACLALVTGLTYAKQQIGGIIVCNGILIAHDVVLDRMSDFAKTTPILMVQGKEDEVMVWNDVQTTLDLLRTKGVADNIQVLAEEGIGHQISPQGFDQITKFISKQLQI